MARCLFIARWQVTPSDGTEGIVGARGDDDDEGHPHRLPTAADTGVSQVLRNGNALRAWRRFGFGSVEQVLAVLPLGDR